jgi:hypothetical protein
MAAVTSVSVDTTTSVPNANGDGTKIDEVMVKCETPAESVEKSATAMVVDGPAETVNALDTSEADLNQSKSRVRRDQRRRARVRRSQKPKTDGNDASTGIKRPSTNTADMPPNKKASRESEPEKVLYSPELKLSIVDDGNTSRRTIEFMNSIRLQEALEDAVFSGNSSFVPKFHGSGLINGIYKVTCFNNKSVEWLRMTVERLPPLWLGARLRVIGKSDQSMLKKMVVFLPGSSIDPELFLRRLAHQNPKLETDTWRIFRVERKDRGQVFYLGIDEDSLTVLKELDNQPFYGLTRLNFRLMPKVVARIRKLNAGPKAVSGGRFAAGRAGSGGRRRPKF